MLLTGISGILKITIIYLLLDDDDYSYIMSAIRIYIKTKLNSIICRDFNKKK